jgi:hypothetical protein
MIPAIDAYWDELGVSWRAFNPDLTVIAQRLRLRLRSQAVCASALLVLGMPLSLAILVLGTFTVWLGASTGTWNFVTRGVALIVIAILLAFASWSQRMGARGEASTLSQMIDLAILRVASLRKAALVGIVICAVAAVFGTVGYVIRINMGRAPAMSPLEAWVLLVLAIAVLVLYRHRTAEELKRLRYLRRALMPEQKTGA